MNKEINTRSKNGRSAQKKGKITAVPDDIFTRLCRKEMGTECIREYRFYKPRKWRFDYALPYYKIALEVEGGIWTQGRHTRPRGFLGDIEKYNTATLLGWRVFRTTPDKLITNSTLLLLKNAISGSFLDENNKKNT